MSGVVNMSSAARARRCRGRSGHGRRPRFRLRTAPLGGDVEESARELVERGDVFQRELCCDGLDSWRSGRGRVSGAIMLALAQLALTWRRGAAILLDVI